jgi:S-adenosylmethionine:tRNA ribosyltransferase-isomerase
MIYCPLFNYIFKLAVDPRDIKIKDYIYDLPEDRIAPYPLAERDASKLLIYRGGHIGSDIFHNLGKYLNRGDMLVYNQTKVIRARLLFRKATGALIEIFCLEPERPSDYENNFASMEPVEWLCMVGRRKKWKSGPLVMEIDNKGKRFRLYAEQISQAGSESLLRFTWDNRQLSFSEVLELAGHMPVPPYLKREDEDIDKIRYQTVYSKEEGSVAAPTAGLHFTEKVLSELKRKGIETASVTLHVGAGTFVPVKSETAGGHDMHIEHFRIGRDTIKNISGKRIIAVGTTSLRSLESLYWIGHRIYSGSISPGDEILLEQWYPYDNQSDLPVEKSMQIILEYMNDNHLDHIEARTGIIIVPGYSMKVAKGLLTNYHLPGSTLLLLVAAFTGGDWKRIYEYSLENDFRFLSYGDSSLLLP